MNRSSWPANHLSEKTVAANVLKWGTGALNIDGCRIEGNQKPKGGSWAMAAYENQLLVAMKVAGLPM